MGPLNCLFAFGVSLGVVELHPGGRPYWLTTFNEYNNCIFHKILINLQAGVKCCCRTFCCIVAFTNDPHQSRHCPTGPERTVSQSELPGCKLTINISLPHEYAAKTLASDFTLDLGARWKWSHLTNWTWSKVWKSNWKIKTFSERNRVQLYLPSSFRKPPRQVSFVLQCLSKAFGKKQLCA